MVNGPSALPEPIQQAFAQSSGSERGPAGGRGGRQARRHTAVMDFFADEILSGRLHIGDQLPSEGDIAARFHVSTRTVREALQILETRGLIQRRHGERATVAREDVGEFLGSLAVTLRQLFSSDPQYFVQLMDVRRLIEVDVVSRLAGGEALPPGEIERALEGMRAAALADDFPRFAAWDAAFHLGLVHAVPNQVLHALYENLYALIVEVIRVSARVPFKPMTVGFAEHSEIHQLIRAGNARAARQAIERHLEDSAGYVRQALQKTPPA